MHLKAFMFIWPQSELVLWELHPSSHGDRFHSAIISKALISCRIKVRNRRTGSNLPIHIRTVFGQEEEKLRLIRERLRSRERGESSSNVSRKTEERQETSGSPPTVFFSSVPSFELRLLRAEGSPWLRNVAADAGGGRGKKPLCEESDFDCRCVPPFFCFRLLLLFLPCFHFLPSPETKKEKRDGKKPLEPLFKQSRTHCSCCCPRPLVKPLHVKS